ncbi:MAG: DUF1700 domain-containing protein [Oscillospiraceae bacterium]|jgi:uncharacterized membrane protein|nr:DUF1700 domain-containing protein [Oscillospiraceae bacterium]
MYKTKSEFLSNLEKELGRFGVLDRSEIITDFEQHFTDSLALGLSESEICEKLGSISEIAKQYAEEEIYPAVAVEREREEQSGSGINSAPPPQNNSSSNAYENSGIRFGRCNNKTSSDYENSGIRVSFGSNNVNWGGLLAVLCVDIFVFSWAIPALFAVFVGLLSVPFGLITAGLASMIAGVIGNFWSFTTPFSGLAAFFLGLMLLSLGGLLTVAGIQLIKLFIFIIKAIIDWHGNMIVGRPVFKKKNARTSREEVSA